METRILNDLTKDKKMEPFMQQVINSFLSYNMKETRQKIVFFNDFLLYLLNNNLSVSPEIKLMDESDHDHFLKLIDKEIKIKITLEKDGKDILSDELEQPDEEDPVDNLDTKGLPLLHYAVENNLLNTVDHLIETYSDVNLKDKNGHTALMHAVVADDSVSSQRLIDAKANMSIEDRRGFSALNHAVYHNNVNMVRFLLEKGAWAYFCTVVVKSNIGIFEKRRQKKIINLLREVSACSLRNFNSLMIDVLDNAIPIIPTVILDIIVSYDERACKNKRTYYKFFKDDKGHNYVEQQFKTSCTIM